MSVEKEIAKHLLQINAIKLEPTNPFTWASGWKSPIYCDNRKTLSFPVVRNYIRDRFVDVIKEKYPEAEVIAGVATGAIAQGVLVAQELDLPNIYVRSKPKGHGMENMIEGHYEKGQKVVVIEDLISTGGSSLKAVEALRAAGCEVLGMVAIFTYGFAKADENIKEANCEVICLSNYSEMIEAAAETGYVTKEDVDTLQNWRKDPANWNA
jgi:orotate phosphoribosyltransferase